MVQAPHVLDFGCAPLCGPGDSPSPRPCLDVTGDSPSRRMLDQDAELIDHIRKGATDDFAQLIQRHQSRVFAMLYRYERDRQKLEDLAQETFVKAWRALDGFDGRAPFEYWLARIASRVALDHLRREGRRKAEIAIEDLGEDALDWLGEGDENSSLEAAQAAELLALALRQLSPAEQIVLTMQGLEGRSIKEIAQNTGSSRIAVRVRALRARQKLRKILLRLTQSKP